MYERKGFLHWYFEQGMEQKDFNLSDVNVRDLILEHQDTQDFVFIKSDEEESDEDEDETGD